MQYKFNSTIQYKSCMNMCIYFYICYTSIDYTYKNVNKIYRYFYSNTFSYIIFFKYSASSKTTSGAWGLYMNLSCIFLFLTHKKAMFGCLMENNSVHVCSSKTSVQVKFN